MLNIKYHGEVVEPLESTQLADSLAALKQEVLEQYGTNVVKVSTGEEFEITGTTLFNSNESVSYAISYKPVNNPNKEYVSTVDEFDNGAFKGVN